MQGLDGLAGDKGDDGEAGQPVSLTWDEIIKKKQHIHQSEYSILISQLHNSLIYIRRTDHHFGHGFDHYTNY